MKKTDVHWRLATRRSATTSAAVMDGRFLYESARWTFPTSSFVTFGQNTIASGSTLQLYNVTTTDGGSTGSATSTITPGTTLTRQTATPTLIDNNRYIINQVRTSGTSTLGSAFLIINAHD